LKTKRISFGFFCNAFRCFGGLFSESAEEKQKNMLIIKDYVYKSLSYEENDRFSGRIRPLERFAGKT